MRVLPERGQSCAIPVWELYLQFQGIIMQNYHHSVFRDQKQFLQKYYD